MSITYRYFIKTKIYSRAWQVWFFSRENFLHSSVNILMCTWQILKAYINIHIYKYTHNFRVNTCDIKFKLTISFMISEFSEGIKIKNRLRSDIEMELITLISLYYFYCKRRNKLRTKILHQITRWLSTKNNSSNLVIESWMFFHIIYEMKVVDRKSGDILIVSLYRSYYLFIPTQLIISSSSCC